ncbi:MAG: hypothetical protein HYR62_03540 [Actinobacteria bacterium]|nr:hypothetical protein [Actinomycetota bacterium]MBI3686572.1 hypothetical protein [Actinomycetota bacterium]
MFTPLAGILDQIEDAGLELVEMVLADAASWDRYEATKWGTADRWVRAHQVDPDAQMVRERTARERHAYLTYGRRYLGWGVFVIR